MKRCKVFYNDDEGVWQLSVGDNFRGHKITEISHIDEEGDWSYDWLFFYGHPVNEEPKEENVKFLMRINADYVISEEFV